MAYITTGLPNGGHTTYYAVDYDDSLSSAQGFDVARQLMDSCDDDYRLLVSWFRGATNMPGRLPVHVDKSTGGASWWGWGPVYNVYLGLGETVFGVSPVMLARYLLVSEVSEIFMRQRQFVPNYWFSASNEGNKGEALSCFLANEMLRHNSTAVMPRTSSGSFAKASAWLGSGRSNFLNLNDANIDPNVDPEIACGISFLNYLCYQRGVAIGEIIAHGSDTFEGVFANLGLGTRADAFAAFVGMVNSHYPTDSRLNTNPVLDNAFPAPEMVQFVATPQVSWRNIGLPPTAVVQMSRPAPLDTLVMLSTDRPDLLGVPVDGIVRRGQDEFDFSFTVKPQGTAFTTANATITAQYAGQTLGRLVQVYAPSSWPMPALRIVADTPVDPCADAFVEGTRQSFSVANLSAFPNRRGLSLRWQVRGTTGTSQPNGTFVIDALPVAGTQVHLSVVATSSDGVTASGQFDLTVRWAITGLAHELASFECRIKHLVDIVARLPRLPLPQYKVRREEVLKQLAVSGKELAAQAADLAKAARSVEVKAGSADA